MPFSFKSLGFKDRPDEVPPDVLRALLREVRNILPEDAAFANSLWPQAGDFLSSRSLRALIRDEIEDERVAAEIEENRRLLDRLSSLLPALSDIFAPADSDNLIGFLGCIDDCCDDYLGSRERPRKDRQLREAHEAMNLASQRLASAVKALETAKRFVETEYAEFHDLYFHPEEEISIASFAQTERNKRDRYPSIEDLTREMRVCQGVFDIVQARAIGDPEKLFIFGNDGKNHIVAYAHMMSLMWNGPAITTTPGSDFALLCSLLFECATGQADESLAGAINRYARSPRRFKKEEEEKEFTWQETSEDNFADIRSQIRFSLQEIEECKAILETGTLDGFARTLLLLRSRHNLRYIEAASQIYGPRQVWMSHLSEDQLAHIAPIAVDVRAVTKLDIELGNLRRSRRLEDKRGA
jgi:hypothetical protein